MPNWCDNYLSLTGPRDKINEIVEAATSVNPDAAGMFQHVLPLDENTGVLGAAEAWGTKWDINDADILDFDEEVSYEDLIKVEMSFMTAWAPPAGVYEQLDNEGFYVYAAYYEPGVCVCGVFDEGEIREYDFENLDPESFRDNEDLERLDDMFGITESELFDDEEEEDLI